VGLTYGPDLAEEMAKDKIVISYLKDIEAAKDFYRALCNMRWRLNTPEDEQIMDRLKGVRNDVCSYSWRYAGGVIAEIRDSNYNTNEDYIDFYCAGGEGDVSDLVKECFERMGWMPFPWEDDDDDI
jgi:hypothetical protein